LARLERQGMIVKANSACASKLPPNPKKGINTVFNHFRDKPARYLVLALTRLNQGHPERPFEELDSIVLD
jgi:hypothetical protein